MTGPADRFLKPASPHQRRYEALRARFVEGCSTAEAARRFGYTPGSFRNLCSRFLNQADPAFLFPDPPARPRRRAPDTRPPDRRRARIRELRASQLSIHDIHRALQREGQGASIGFIHKVLKEAGLTRLARRPPDQRPAVLAAPVADRRELDLSPRRLRTDFGGLFLFAHDLAQLDLDHLVRDLPGSRMIPPGCAIRALLALKLWGIGRPSRVMPEVLDAGIALFAGLNAMPKRATLTEYSCRVDPRHLTSVMERWHHALAGLDRRLGHGQSFDLDFHTIPYHGDEALIEKHYVSKRSRRQKGILTFLARDAGARSFVWANATVTRATQHDAILRFVDAWTQRTGAAPAELVFDSRLTTYANLARLEAAGIAFLTLRRRTARMVDALLAAPSSQWRRITLHNVGRAYRTPRILDQTVPLRDYPRPIRQIAITDLGHDRPTLLLTNQMTARASDLIDRYARRMVIENTIADAIDFFHMDALSAAVPLKIDVDVQLTVMASALYRTLAARLGDGFDTQKPGSLFRKLVKASATIDITPTDIIVTLGRRAYNPHLLKAGFAERQTPIPWLDQRRLNIRFA